MRFSFDPSALPRKRVRSLAIVGSDDTVTDRVVDEGALAGDPDRSIKMVTLDFLASGGDGLPFPVPSPGRIDLRGEAGQFNALDPDFPDTNENGVIDGPVMSEPGFASFAAPGAEQNALAEYLAHFYRETPFDQAETPPMGDRRIQNLGIPGKADTVFEGPHRNARPR